MKKKERGMTLVEVLATLVLISLVTGLIWTTVSIATKFGVSETSELKLQQEANYIITELQRIHRNCYTYELIIKTDEIKIENCYDEDKALPKYDGVISNTYIYYPVREPRKTYTTEGNLDIPDFEIIDPVNQIRSVKIPVSISRYKTEQLLDEE